MFVVMGDGEQQKGQLAEARAWAAKISVNPADGDCGTRMVCKPADRLATSCRYQSRRLILLPAGMYGRVEGHNYQQLYRVLKTCYDHQDQPTLILAGTLMGKGISFLENKYESHGRVLNKNELFQAEKELGELPDATESIAISTSKTVVPPVEFNVPKTPVRCYSGDKNYDCRSAAGAAIEDIVEACKNAAPVPVAVLDCDLAGSVRTQKIKERFPDAFIECGIEEHHTATLAGALSRSGILTFWAEFGVFGIDEVYGQHRMNDFNSTSIKMICTHNGLDVGEDGKTHQCIDYISLLSNLYGYKLVIPADANQADRMVRFMAAAPGNIVLATGRSAVPIIADETGEPLFGGDYVFVYGKADWVRRGTDGDDFNLWTDGCTSHPGSRRIKTSEVFDRRFECQCPPGTGPRRDSGRGENRPDFRL